MTPPYRRRLAVFVGIAALPLALGSPAAADKLSDKKAEAAKIERQLEAQGQRVSVAAERFNQARLKVDKIQGSLTQATVDITRSEERMSQVRERMAHAAVVAYVHGGSNSMLSHLTRVDGDAVVRRQYLRVTSLEQRDVIGDLRAAREDLTQLRGVLEAQQDSAKSALKDAESARRAAAAAESEQLRLLRQVKGEVATLVAAEQARREAEAARQARAALAARPPVPVQVKGQSTPPRPAPPATGRGGIAVEEAKKQVGKPYVWGGSGPNSFDCSGLTAWAWKAAGVSLSHSAQSQYYETARVPIDSLAPGDLVFFGSNTSSIHHNAIYIGGGQMIEASRTGFPVRYANVYRRDLVGAGRPG